MDKPIYPLDAILFQLQTSNEGQPPSYAKWSQPTVTYFVAADTPVQDGPRDEGDGYEAMAADQAQAATGAFRIWAELIGGIDLVPTTNLAAADITLAPSANTYDGGTYTHRYVGSQFPGLAVYPSFPITGANVWVDADDGHTATGAFAYSTYGLQTLLHEVGHALGLTHPRTYNETDAHKPTYDDDAVYAQDTRQYTIMSYFGSDTLDGGAGVDLRVATQGGADRLLGGYGDDTIALHGIAGGTGVAEAYGGPGHDIISIIGDNAAAYGEDGLDVLSVVGDSDSLYGDGDDDRYVASPGHDTYDDYSGDHDMLFLTGRASDHVVTVNAFGSPVFADGNWRLDSGEASTLTNAAGAFTLAAGITRRVATGGMDTATGLALTIPLSAPAGSSVITPLTTLIDALGEVDSVASAVLDHAAGAIAAANQADVGDVGGVPCYCPGTLILTDRGERPVEALVAGDVVVTAGGVHRTIRRVGRKRHGVRFPARRPELAPVRLRAGSLAPVLGSFLPRRDLLVSPDHAMGLEGVLVPARLLVNGDTILHEAGVDEAGVDDAGRNGIDYHHLELDSHDLLLAEGTPAESFVDDGSRVLFDDAGQGRPRGPARFCAPVVTGGFLLHAILVRLVPAMEKLAA